MAFISTKEVKEKRDIVKKKYTSKEGWKFSITCQNYSCINLAIIEAPIQLLEDSKNDYETINPYWINENYKNQKREILKDLYKIINKNNFDKSDSQTDYFHVGFYVNISIGKYDKPFKVKNLNTNK